VSLIDELKDYINAAFTGLWVQTHEPDEAERDITRHAAQSKWKLAIWDIAHGLRLPSSTGQPESTAEGKDPLAALRALPALADKDSSALLLLHNFHRFLNNPEVIQTTFHQLIAGKQQGTFLIVLAPVVQIPVELEKLFVVIEHTLPDREQLHRIAQELTSDKAEELPKEADLQHVLDAAAGLTRYEAEGAFALSIARHSTILPGCVTQVKAQALRKNNLLTLHSGQECFENLGGLQSLKDFCRRALSSSRLNREVKPRGVLLLSPPGCGKSVFAKALGNETERPTLLLDLAALFGSLVGQTEQNVRQALRIADAMSPCILMVDELEKGLSGVGSQGDSGVASRLFGSLLCWLADHQSEVFFIGTCNDVSRMPPEFSRAERFDGVFFLDLPTSQEKNAIWQMYRTQFDIPKEQVQPNDTDWTGAEIKSCCRLSALLDVTLTQAAHHVVPVAVTAAEQVDKLRTWASGRCLSAAEPGIYSRSGTASPKPGRRVQRPSNN
jgi:ATP-dependent 26S proteasome regulatory subunit